MALMFTSAGICSFNVNHCDVTDMLLSHDAAGITQGCTPQWKTLAAYQIDRCHALSAIFLLDRGALCNKDTTF